MQVCTHACADRCSILQYTRIRVLSVYGQIDPPIGGSIHPPIGGWIDEAWIGGSMDIVYACVMFVFMCVRIIYYIVFVNLYSVSHCTPIRGASGTRPRDNITERGVWLTSK